LERTGSTVLQGRCALRQTSNTCCALQSFDNLQTESHVIHRPFETVSSVSCSKTNTHTDRPPSPAVSDCQPDNDRRDVTSWADCLRQLAISLRRRQDAADVSDQAPVAVLAPADVGSLDQATTVDDLCHCRPDGKQRNPGYDDDIMQHNQLQSVSDEDCRSIVGIINDNNNLPVNKLDPSTTENARSIDDLQCSLSFNATAVQGRSVTHTDIHTTHVVIIGLYSDYIIYIQHYYAS